MATLVARGGSRSEVFSAVAQEMARCLDVENADVFRDEDNGATIVAVAAFAGPGVPDHSVGERLTTEGDNISSMVWRTKRAARMDSWESAAGSIAERIRMLGLQSRVGAQSWWMNGSGGWRLSATHNPTRCHRTPRNALPNSPT